MTTLTKTNKFQNNIVFLFIGILFCAIIGFHKSYTIHFPQFNGFHWEQHFHGAMLMSWFLLLIIQPLLIRYKMNSIHRNLGKIGYLLAPLVCYSIFLVTRMAYYRDMVNRPEVSVLGKLALPVPSILFFGLFFALAMINRKDSAVHMRYMIATSLLMIGPGLGRTLIFFGGMPFPMSVNVAGNYIPELIAVIFLLNDIRKANNVKPFLTITVFLIIHHLCWAFQTASWWQTIAKWVTYLF